MKQYFNQAHIKKYPYNSPSVSMKYSRHLYINIEDLHNSIKELHQKQKLQYRFDIQFGTTLRDVQTGESRHYYPSSNTSFYYCENIPVINNDESVNNLLDELSES